MNEIVNKFLLAGDKFMPEIHLKQPGFTYSACGPFTKNKERIQKFKETGDTCYIYKSKLDKACFQHDMAYRDFKDLKRRTFSDKILRDKVVNIAKNPKYDGYQRGLASMVYKFFDKKSALLTDKSVAGGGVANNEINSKNWRPISLLNVDTKIISKVLSGHIKEVLPSLISSNQTAYVEGRIISESGRLISDILEITDLSKLNGILLTIDIEKAFDSVNHAFLISVLEKYGFGKNFLKWINVLLNNQESCVINEGFTTQYFKLERGTRQGDPISAYLFVLVLDIVFLLIQENKKIHGLNIFNHTFLYTAYADDPTFFLSNQQSVTEVIKVFEQFLLFSGLKPNKSKCEVAGIGALKRVSVALCGMECIDLTTKTIKILGIHFSYNNIVKNNENFMKHIRKIEQVLKLWRMRYLSIEGKITVFKTLALSKIIHLALVTDVPKSTILALNKIQKEFIGIK